MADEIELLRRVSELIPEPTTGAWVRARAAIAAAREEDLPGKVTRRSARHLLALRSLAGVAAALAAGAVALAAVGIPGVSDHGAKGTGTDAAYVVKRVDSALSAAEPAEIGQMTVTTTSAAADGKTETTVTKEWSYRGQRRSMTYLPTGRLIDDWTATASAVYTVVSYPTRTWARGREPGSPAASPPASGSHDCARAVRGVMPVTGMPLPFFSAGGSALTILLLQVGILLNISTYANYERI